MSGESPAIQSDTPERRPGAFSFRGRMLLYFGLTFAVGLFAIAVSSLYGIPFTEYRGEYGMRRSEALRELNLLADTKKAELLHMIAERRGDASAFCESPVLRRLVSRVCSLARETGGAGSALPRLRSAMLKSDDYRSLTGHLSAIKQIYMAQYDRIRLADAATGLIIASTDENDFGRDISRDPGFIMATGAGQVEAINVQRDAGSGNAYLAIYHAVREAPLREGEQDGPPTAVLILYLKPDLFVKSLELSEQQVGKSGEIMLVDQDTRLLTVLQRPLPDGTLPRPLESRLDSKAARLAADGNEGVIASDDYAGVPVMAAFRHLRLNSEVGWGLVVKKDRSEVFAPLRRLVAYFSLKAAILFLLVLGLTYAVATKLSRPVKLLSRMAKRVEQGEFDVRAPVEGSDEVAALSGSFNAMVQRIRNWHNELEEQVNARTADLVRLNEELEDEIAERSRAEEALHASEGRFRELLETVQMVAVILDRDGNITFCNDFLLSLTGWSRDEVLGRNWFDTFIPEEVRDRVKGLFDRALDKSPVPMHYENLIVARDGARRNIVWDNTLLCGADGDLIGIAGLGTDVTEHRSLEEQLRHSQKMEAIGQLAGGVAHDFNNLLTAIISNCELIRMKSGPDNPVSGYLDQIMLVSGKAAKLTQSLLAFSRKQYLSVQGLDINDCVREIDRLLSRVIGENIDFRLSLSGGRLPVMADQGRMEQVLVNLATNARDAMPGGGELLIETRRVDLDALSAKLHGLEKGGAYAVIHVSDTGCGMDAATRERIFDPFFTTKEVGKGTGLGLAMVFGTIRQHGGYIDVYSEPGRGALFKIYLPLIHEAADAGDDAAPEPATPVGDETVLVVEDNEDVRRSTAMMLGEFGYRVIEAADGDEALARFTENRDCVSLVILDVIMPGMNGKEVYDALRRLKPDMKALFISGYAADIISRTVMNEEGLHLLQKPVTLAELLQKVREILDNG